MLFLFYLNKVILDISLLPKTSIKLQTLVYLFKLLMVYNQEIIANSTKQCSLKKQIQFFYCLLLVYFSLCNKTYPFSPN